MDEFIKDNTITCHETILEYINNKEIHSVLKITFGELFHIVYSIIQKHPNSDDIKKVLNEEMTDSICKCFTGRLSRLVNVLNGFDDRVQITLSKNQVIGNYVIQTKHHDIQVWKTNFINIMTQNGLEKEINEWIEFIE